QVSLKNLFDPIYFLFHLLFLYVRQSLGKLFSFISPHIQTII
ncbi:hypothetical protein HMPREF1370_01566, partial [Enterococcus faecium P1123]